MKEEIYFVDQRVGCIAVRNSRLTDPDYPGLHRDTPGVVNYWQGINGPDGWEVPEAFVQAAKLTCDELNRHC